MFYITFKWFRRESRFPCTARRLHDRIIWLASIAVGAITGNCLGYVDEGGLKRPGLENLLQLLSEYAVYLEVDSFFRIRLSDPVTYFTR